MTRAFSKYQRPYSIQYSLWVLSTLALLIVMTARDADAKPFNDACPDIPTCAKSVAELTGDKYIFDSDVKGQVKSAGQFELTKENADLLFTKALDMNGFSRVPLGEPKHFQIMRQRDARDSALPMFSGDATKAPELPNNWDQITFIYQATNDGVVDYMARNLRSFMPANSRIIPNEITRQVYVTDTAINMRKVYELLRMSDVKPSTELRKRWAEYEKERQRVRLIETANPKPRDDEEPPAGPRGKKAPATPNASGEKGTPKS